MTETSALQRIQLSAWNTRSQDLGGGSQNNWVSPEGEAFQRAYIRYSFRSDSGYTQRLEDCSVEGAAILFDYDLTASPMKKKRQYVLGAYAYVEDRSWSFQGSLPSGSAFCYLSSSNKPGRVKLPRGLSSGELGDLEPLLEALSPGAYHKVPRQYLYPQPAVSGSGLYSNQEYSAEAEIRFCGRKGAHPPYLEVAVEDVQLTPWEVWPKDCFADPTEAIVLRWTPGYEEGATAVIDGKTYRGTVAQGPKQQSAKLFWRETGSETVHEVQLATVQRYELPVGSVGEAGFQWKLQLCSDDGVWGPVSDWYSVRCQNDSSSTATALHPQKCSVDGQEALLFTWEQQNDSGSRPTGADLQYALPEGEWQTFAQVESRDCQALIPAGTLPAGTLRWRVRSYNASGVAGPWSPEVTVVVRSAPPKPLLEPIDPVPLPLIRWQGVDQVAARVTVDGRSKILYNDETQLQWEELLTAGTHLVQVEIQNHFGLWSAAAALTLEVENFPQEGFLLEAEAVENGVCLRWSRSFPLVELWRGESLVARLRQGELCYCDWEGAGEEVYLARGLTEEGYYSDSNSVVAAPLVEGAALGCQGQWLQFRGRYEAPVQHQVSVSQGLELRHYSGIALPKALPDGQWQRRHRFDFSLELEELPQLRLLQSWCGRSVLYKDRRGQLLRGCLETVDCQDRGSWLEISFSIVETREEENG